MLMLITFVLGMSVSGFAQSDVNGALEIIKQEIINRVSEAPVNTVYGLVESTNEKYVVNTPFGKYDIKKNQDGSLEAFGLKAKLESKRGHIYVVNSSIGRFKIDTKKCTITKIEQYYYIQI